MNKGVWLGPAVLLLATSACRAGQSPPAAVDQPSPTSAGVSTSTGASTPSEAVASSEPDGRCAEAPTALGDHLSGGLLVRGAYVSNLYIAPAQDLTEPPSGFGDPWWAAGKITGTGVRPEVGIWLWDRVAAAGVGMVLSANASASRYFRFDALDPPLASASQTARTLVDCVGPMPEP
jgi:hypothetical protein